MTRSEFEKQLQSALSLEMHYADRIHRDLTGTTMAQATPASVLILLGHSQGTSELDSTMSSPSILYIRRTDDVETHKGQIAFPGGHTEPDELSRPEMAALRETEEEVGISRQNLKLIGRLPQLFTATGYLIQPFVGILNRALQDEPLVLDPKETAEAIWVPLDSLLGPGTYESETFSVGNVNYPIDVYRYQHHRIWGATGSMTKNLLDRLNQVGTF
jgi:8-oxo-dGTP pyrophosphatase MutT (NUDIX family)